MASELKWSCGCHEVDGALVEQCTQVSPQGEISAEQHGVNKPFSRKCARLANAPVAVSAVPVDPLEKAAWTAPVQPEHQAQPGNPAQEEHKAQ